MAINNLSSLQHANSVLLVSKKFFFLVDAPNMSFLGVLPFQLRARAVTRATWAKYGAAFERARGNHFQKGLQAVAA